MVMNKILIICLSVCLSTKVANSQTEVTFYTTMGDFVVEMYDTLQPITAGNFIDLVNTEFYDGVIFHRVIYDFMIQGGDPTGTGSGGPGYTILDEFDPLTSNVQGTISMANAGPNTGGSQFFINLVNNTYLDPNHPVFGEVITNFSIVESIGLVATGPGDRPLTDVIMDSVRVTFKGPYVGITEEQNAALNISIFPNPTADFITINIGNYLGAGYTLEITNILGATVYSTLLNQKQSTFDLSSYCPQGIYFVNVIDEQKNRMVTKKLIVQ